MPNTGELRCLEMKMIGKPYCGKPHVRFDEGEQDFVLWKTLNGHEAGNGGYGQGLTYRMMCLFSTLPFIALYKTVGSTDAHNFIPYLSG